MTDEIKKENRKPVSKIQITIRRNKNGMFYTQIKFKNGRIFAHSEDYSSLIKALRSTNSFIDSMKKEDFTMTISQGEDDGI